MINGIVTRLLATSGVTNLIVNRVYPVVADQTALKPYVTLRRLGVIPTIVKNETSDKDQVRFGVYAHADEYKVCVNVLQAIRTSIDNLKGTFDSVDFKNIWYVGSEDLFDETDKTYIIVDTYECRIQK